MGEAFDEDIIEWKEDVEETKQKILLLEEVKKVQVPRIGEDDMLIFQRTLCPVANIMLMIFLNIASNCFRKHASNLDLR